MGAVTTSASPAKAQNRPPSRRPPPHPQWYPLAPPHWRPVARPAGALWPMGYRREPLLSLAQGGDLGAPLSVGPTTSPPTRAPPLGCPQCAWHHFPTPQKRH